MAIWKTGTAHAIGLEASSVHAMASHINETLARDDVQAAEAVEIIALGHAKEIGDHGPRTYFDVLIVYGQPAATRKSF